ncbi:hypothetical protein B0H19DRAFT_1385533, partial [Mycena capillaripes]
GSPARCSSLVEPSELILVQCLSAASGPEPVAVSASPEHLPRSTLRSSAESRAPRASWLSHYVRSSSKTPAHSQSTTSILCAFVRKRLFASSGCVASAVGKTTGPSRRLSSRRDGRAHSTVFVITTVRGALEEWDHFTVDCSNKRCRKKAL